MAADFQFEDTASKLIHPNPFSPIPRFSIQFNVKFKSDWITKKKGVIFNKYFYGIKIKSSVLDTRLPSTEIFLRCTIGIVV